MAATMWIRVIMISAILQWSTTSEMITEDVSTQYSVPTTPERSTPHSRPIEQSTCRFWDGHTDRQSYRLVTCGHCYKYLFPENTELVPYGTYLVSINGTVFPHGTFVKPDISNATLTKRICETLESQASCNQWLECCEAAEFCCSEQLNDASAGVVDAESRDCPSTWDGFACWGRVKAGTSAKRSCPSYVPHAIPTENAMKTCTVNGTWYRDPDSNKEWTNYTSCVEFDVFKVNIYIKLACNVLSLLALIPSLAIFFAYRTLRNQHRVRLHMHLFSSFILFAIINILWELLVVYERMNKESSDTRMGANTNGCKFLYVMTRYSKSTNYLWMFCEGLYLHRLIVKAFTPPKRLLVFYILGWGFPWLPVVTYSILRIFMKNESCWVQHIGGYEWIIYIPNLVALIANLVFMIDILRILLTQLQTHPNEPSNYRRALKATFVLVPLFGLQLFLVIYRPPLGSRAGAIYENISAFIVNSQGFFVALIFCLVNGEVLTNLRRTCMKYGYCLKDGTSRSKNFTMTTQASETYTKESPSSSFRAAEGATGKNKDYIALKTIDDTNGYAEVVT